LIQFCGLLRERELQVTPARALDAARSLELIDVSDRSAFQAALRTNLTISVDDYPAFDRAFREFWGAQAANLRPETVEDRATATAGASAGREVYRERLATAASEQEPADALRPGGRASASESDIVTRRRLAAVDRRELRQARRIARRTAPALATVESRRTQAAPSGGTVDLRRTVRAARRSGGELLRLARQRRKLQRLRIVALLDISGSMDVYSGFLLQFLYALQTEAGQVRTFVFSTRLQEITAALQRKSYDEALQAIAATADRWGGGTAISDSLADFNRRFGLRLVGPRTVVIILSDGWERGDPAHLAREMAVLQRRARTVIWLNPLKGHAGYRPLARGMAAALPYVDHFLPAHDLAALEALRTALAR
jgi:hypothetical protein